MIKFQSVTFKHRNGVVAVKDINLDIFPNEITTIVGANGAGKTTLVKHINGLLKPTQGQVNVFGIDTRKVSVAQLSKKVGIVFQNPVHQLFSDSVANEIIFALKNFGYDEETIKKRVDWALGSFNLQEYRDFSPLMLSSGEKKRLCIATVLAWDPDIIIFDEPTAGQDYIQKERLGQIIRMLVQQGKSVIIVTHDIEFIWPLSPRVIVMSKGSILADGPANLIFDDDRVIKEASIARPQLMELARSLKIKPKNPFENVHQSRGWILSHIK